jgi:hypothetical protein
MFGSNTKSFLVSALSLHFAAFAVVFCLIISQIRFGPTSELTIMYRKAAIFSGNVGPLSLLAVCLVVACAMSHARYIQTLWAARTTGQAVPPAVLQRGPFPLC